MARPLADIDFYGNERAPGRYFDMQRADEYDYDDGETEWGDHLTSLGFERVHLWCKSEYMRANQSSSRHGVEEVGHAPVDYVQGHPEIPVAPEALARYTSITDAVACSNDGYSKATFQLLMNNYPNTEAAQRTKYWYN